MSDPLANILVASGLSYERPPESDAEDVRRALTEAGYVLVQRSSLHDLVELLRRSVAFESGSVGPDSVIESDRGPFELSLNASEVKRLSQILPYLAEVLK